MIGMMSLCPILHKQPVLIVYDDISHQEGLVENTKMIHQLSESPLISNAHYVLQGLHLQQVLNGLSLILK